VKDGHVFSHSQIETFEGCPKRYAFRYVRRAKSKKPPGIEGYMGTRVHAVAERTFHHVAHHNKIPALSQLLDVYTAEWDSERPKAGLFIARKGMDEASYRATGARSLGRFRDLISSGRVDPRPAGVERVVDFTIGGRPFTGVIDYLGPDVVGGVEIRDWKTGKPKTQAEAQVDRQLALYEIGLRQTYPAGTEFKLVHEYLANGLTITTTRTPEQLDLVHSKTFATVEAIERAASAGSWPARPSPLCNWCDWSDTCPESRAR